MDINTRVIKTVAEQLGVDVDQVTPDKAFADLGGDSLDQVELMMGLEDEFGIELPDDAWEKTLTVQSAIDLVTRVTA